jgi:tetratricopeptide (TPR) repeat protein
MNEKVDKTRVIEQAERLVKAGRIEEAIDEYRKLLAGEAADLSINNLIGDLYIQLGRIGEAVQAFQGVGSFYETKGYHSQALAVYRKINKLDPHHVIAMVKMGDLYAAQGFAAEAKKEYLKAEQILRQEKRLKELMFLYDKLIKLDSDNISFKLSLAGIFQQEGFIEEAVVQLNDASELLLSQDDLKEAEKVIEQARWLKADDERTLTNLIEVLKRSGRRDEAIEIVQDVLSRDETNVRFRGILGTLHLEDGKLEKAEEIFSDIIAEDPLEARARVKLGKVYALQDKPEKAYAIFEPLIENLLKKQKEDKAIGLLGIVLSAKQIYLPALEKLAAIYKSKNQKANQEVVCRVLLEEARARNLTETMFVALADLMELCPGDESLAKEYWDLRRRLGFIDDRQEEEELLARARKEEDADILLDKADLYVSQGLIRNARRILENLSHKFPDSARIEAKLKSLEKVKQKIKEEEIPLRVEKVQEIENKIEATPDLAKSFLSLLQDQEGEEKRLTAADIFSDTEILPLPVEEAQGWQYYDLTEKIAEELEMIRNVFSQQLRGDISILEKDLSDIVRDFRAQVRRRIDARDFEARYHLGLAFLEQDLLEEAVEEFLLASKDPGRTLECYSIISKAYRKKGNFEEAIRWLQECLKLVGEGTDLFYALQYELAFLYEEMGDKAKALELYDRVRKWNAHYRDVDQKIKSLG